MVVYAVACDAPTALFEIQPSQSYITYSEIAITLLMLVFLQHPLDGVSKRSRGSGPSSVAVLIR